MSVLTAVIALVGAAFLVLFGVLWPPACALFIGLGLVGLAVLRASNEHAQRARLRAGQR